MKNLLFIFILFNCVTNTSISQTVSQAYKINEALAKDSAAQNELSINLLEMSMGANEKDAFVANAASDCSTNTYMSVDLLNAYVGLYPLMLDARDQETIKRYIPIYSRQATKAIERCTTLINKLLPSAKSPAIISEIQKVRNLMVKTKANLP